MNVIANQILVLGLITLVGYLAYVLKAVNKDINQALVRVIMKVTLPLLLFTTVAKLETDSKTLINGVVIFFAGAFAVLVLNILSRGSAKILKLDRQNEALHKAHTMFGNVVFLGFPLMDALFPGGKGLLYATLFQLGQDSLMWTWGIIMLSKSADKSTKHSWKHLFNLNTLAFALGFLFYFTGIKLPPVFNQALSGIGHTTIYLSMVYVGAVLAQVKLFSLIKNLRSYLLSLNKLLLGPIIVAGVLYALQFAGLNWMDFDAIVVIVLQAGMPCMIIVSVIARELGLNDFQATQNIFVSTVLSLGTLPLLYFLLMLLF
ncbi:MAG TPA: AEC family transporter [Bacteroidales bacterium]|nr:AEC family transporter [Bacteroidales bacterium]